MTTKMRHCWNCGDEMGLVASKYYEPTDTCGKPECDLEARYAAQAEQSEAHEQLDRDMGWH